MAIERAAQQKIPIVSVFTITDTAGEYWVHTVPPGRSGVTVAISGTAGGATFTIARQKLNDATIQDYSEGSISVGEEKMVYAGAGTKVFIRSTGNTGSTDVDVEGSIF